MDMDLQELSAQDMDAVLGGILGIGFAIKLAMYTVLPPIISAPTEDSATQA